MTAIPLYPDEATIAKEVLGPKRAKDWPSLAKFLEDKEGLPPIDKQMGGRFWPAVDAYFRQRHNMHVLPHVGDAPPLVPRASSRIQIMPTGPDQRRGEKT